MFPPRFIRANIGGDMAVSVSGTDGTWWVVVEGEGSVEVPNNLSITRQHCSSSSEVLPRTRGDVSISLHASLYRTVGEFFENSSEVRAYRRRAENPAPKRITTKFPVLEAVRTAYWERERAECTRTRQHHDHGCSRHAPFPPELNSDHFFTFSALCLDGGTPNIKGPTASSLRDACFTSRVCESRSDALRRWVA